MEHQADAFVLHSRPYKETGALVTFFCAQRGKFNAIISGVRGSKKAHLKAALLQPFQELQLSWKEKAHSDLVSLRSLDAVSIRLPLDGQAAVCGLYANELLYRLLYPNVSFEHLYQDYGSLLLHLTQLQLQDEQQQARQQSQALRWFELQLLSTLGHGFQFDYDLAGQEILAEQDYLFYPQHGFEILHLEQPIPSYALRISGSCILQLQDLLVQPLPQVTLCSQCLKPLRLLLSSALQPILGNKPIAARALLQKSIVPAQDSV
ncbi:DNA repair protein RecO [Thiosulfatimonas sediminis]|uniref:DNA repair protein RecO n=1 Tax=Thiosulfatimonas sediminis TaxID=2675054 RepID=A0A6F8PVR0_9GAMM|nr:DNA repair protein RecO [Thiosulfatimonas sediminis]BBP46127.1 DNA repair protein RecO [Thiosulfatimonas sediminis]